MKMGMIMDWEMAGAILANADDNDQAKFLKAFVKEMSSWGTNWQGEMQLMSVNRKLTPEEKQKLSAISYIEKDTP